MKTTFSIVTLGCKTNQFESAAVAEQLQRAGYRRVEFESGADLVVVNTCTVTAATDAQSRNLIRRAQRLNPKARVVVTGCYAQVDPHSVRQLPGVSLVLGNEEKNSLAAHLESSRREGEIRVDDIRASTTIKPLSLSRFDRRSRAFVQIQNGCDAFCSYCIIPYARGRSRSVATAAVIGQVEKLSAAGYPEVVLTGIHIGRYGHDLQPRTDLLELLRRIESSRFSGRLRLGSIEPTELPEELLAYIAANPWICPHFHIPLQAGTDDILRSMNRHYSIAHYRNLLNAIRAGQPDAAIGLDIIVGFPGESERHFSATRQLLEDLPFSHLHVFPFSRRPGTPAAAMTKQVPAALIKQRAELLRRIGAEKKRNFMQRFVGRRLEIVLEGQERDGCGKGLSQNYLPVLVPTDSGSRGELLSILITGTGTAGLRGEAVQLSVSRAASSRPR